jgi:hypothetical protein
LRGIKQKYTLSQFVRRTILNDNNSLGVVCSKKMDKEQQQSINPV